MPRMSQKPELISPSSIPNQVSDSGAASVPAPAPELRPAPPHAAQRIPRWLERAELFLRVLLKLYIGLAVCYAPWSRLFWDQNPLFVQFPSLSVYAANGAVRGLVSGVGLLTLWIAFQDALRPRNGYKHERTGNRE